MSIELKKIVSEHFLLNKAEPDVMISKNNQHRADVKQNHRISESAVAL